MARGMEAAVRVERMITGLFPVLLVVGLFVPQQVAWSQAAAEPAAPPAVPTPEARPAASPANPAIARPFAPRGPLTDLSPEQQDAFREAWAREAEFQRVHREELRKARLALADAMFADPLDEGVVREKSLAAGRVLAELAVSRARALAQIRPKLSTEQIARLKTMPLEIWDTLPGRTPRTPGTAPRPLPTAPPPAPTQ